MNLKLYRTLDGLNVVNKTLTSELSFNITARSDFNIINPEIVLSGLSGNDLLDYNYATITELNRSYLITDIITANSKIVKLLLSCDVIETYKNDLLNSVGEIRRNIKAGDYVGSIDSSNFETVSIYESDKTLTDEKVITMSVVGV